MNALNKSRVDYIFSKWLQVLAAISLSYCYVKVQSVGHHFCDFEVNENIIDLLLFYRIDLNWSHDIIWVNAMLAIIENKILKCYAVE